jgi:type II secretory pathway component PulJ
MNPFKWILINRLKHFKSKQKISGFTLIELLVAMLLAFLVITPLLGFMINIMDTDRKEQAKINSEEEIKTALDFIARDLQQAVFIYNTDGIKEIRKELPKYDQKNNYFPVLVFWKRQFIPGGLTIGSRTDDTFVYSLVAYYLIKDNDSTWSKAARIGRFQISNGYGQTDDDRESTRDRGFQLFDLKDEGDLKTKMNKWKKKTDENYTQDILPLVDYIDQTPVDTTTNPAPTCSVGEPIPKFSDTGDNVATGDVMTRGFYVCVDSDNTVAEIYLRGNALARIQQNNLNFNQDNKVYFPQVSIRVKGRGFLFTQ